MACLIHSSDLTTICKKNWVHTSTWASTRTSCASGTSNTVFFLCPGARTSTSLEESKESSATDLNLGDKAKRDRLRCTHGAVLRLFAPALNSLPRRPPSISSDPGDDPRTVARSPHNQAAIEALSVFRQLVNRCSTHTPMWSRRGLAAYKHAYLHETRPFITTPTTFSLFSMPTLSRPLSATLWLLCTTLRVSGLLPA